MKYIKPYMLSYMRHFLLRLSKKENSEFTIFYQVLTDVRIII